MTKSQLQLFASLVLFVTCVSTGCTQPLFPKIPNEISPPFQSVVTGATFGIHLHRADRGTAWPAPRFGSWRLWDAGVTWADLETQPNQWDFARLDRYVAMAEIAGVDVVLPLGMPPQWASSRPNEASAYGAGRAAEPRNYQEWVRYVETVANRYKGRIKYFELWNEVNLSIFYTGSITNLIELQRLAQSAIKRASPTNKLISASFTGNTVSEVRKFGAFLRKGGAASADIIGYHLYTPKLHPDAMVPLVGAIRNEMTDADVSHKPLWNTESGYAIQRSKFKAIPKWMSSEWLQLTEFQGASYWMISYILASQLGVDRSFLYAWDNDAMGFIGDGRDASPVIIGSIKKFVDSMVNLTPSGCKFFDKYSECSFDGISKFDSRIFIWTRAGDLNIDTEKRLRGMQIVDVCSSSTSNPSLVAEKININECPKIVIVKNNLISN